ncbi:MAG: ATP-binding protein, partial [Lachnospiraceae bacterium]|nr:ATP-binding protein [Lachnospiraceae bacterium]
MCDHVKEWEEFVPKVNPAAEFFEIAGDFGDEMEIFREALHNAMDWGATEFRISVEVKSINGKETLVITMSDNGIGMNKDVLQNNFWALGNSLSYDDADKIGEKGHGTKIYLRSTFVRVETSNGIESYESECEGAYVALGERKMHQPRIRLSEKAFPRGTKIIVEGYNLSDDFSSYTELRIKDYLGWFTKVGSVENQFSGHNMRDFKVYLKALDKSNYTEVPMGHIFAKENSNIPALLKEHPDNAVKYYVKKYLYQDEQFEKRPD